MIDIHAHIIPNVDDGSISQGCTLSLVSSAKLQGATTMFATSHSEAFFRNADAVYEAFHKMKTTLEGWFPEMRFYLGCEIFCQKNDMQKILECLADGRLPRMNKTRYVLTEFSPWISPGEAAFCLQELQHAKWIPIIAHPERYVYLDTAFIRALRETGCKVQVNVCSLEEYGEIPLRDRARDLIREELVDFLGSDCHNSFIRGVSIEQGMDWLQHNCSPRYLDAITHRNATRLLINKEVLR